MIKTRLVHLLSDSKKYIVYQILCQWVALVAQIVSIFLVANIIEKAADNKITQKLLIVTFVILLMTIPIRMACDKLATKASFKAGEKVKITLREKIYEKLLRLGSSYREKVSTAEVVQMSTEGVEQLEIYFGKYLPQLFYSLLAPLTLFCVLAFVNLKAAVVLLICVPLIPISIVLVQKIAKRLLNKYWGIYTELGDSFLENLEGLTTLKIYQADGQKAAKMDRESAKFRKITMKVLTMQLNSTSIMDIMAYGGAAVGMIVTGCEFIKGNVGIAGAITIILLASEFFIPLRLLGSFFHIAMNGMAASDKIFNLLDIEEDTERKNIINADKCNITISNVHFSYDESREILKGIDININKGQLVAVVGKSGCGKSTIAGILSGKNRLYTGRVKIGDSELNTINEGSLMKNITLVSHNSHIFAGTVEYNLKMAKPDATREEMEKALKEVNIYDFFEANDGLNTKLGEGGGNLSGGQRQRLALARAILHDSSIYIFDEATSNIDALSEEIIMSVIKKMSGKKTVLLISHRLMNVVDSDKIYVLTGGKIAEMGKHHELLKLNGIYAKLFYRQHKLESYGMAGNMTDANINSGEMEA